MLTQPIYLFSGCVLMLKPSLIHLVVGTQYIAVPNCDGNSLRNSQRILKNKQLQILFFAMY